MMKCLSPYCKGVFPRFCFISIVEVGAEPVVLSNLSLVPLFKDTSLLRKSRNFLAFLHVLTYSCQLSLLHVPRGHLMATTSVWIFMLVASVQYTYLQTIRISLDR